MSVLFHRSLERFRHHMSSLDPSSSLLVLVSPRVQKRVRNEFIGHAVPGVPVTPNSKPLRFDVLPTPLCKPLKRLATCRRGKILAYYKQRQNMKLQEHSPQIFNCHFLRFRSCKHITETQAFRSPSTTQFVLPHLQSWCKWGLVARHVRENARVAQRGRDDALFLMPPVSLNIG